MSEHQQISISFDKVGYTNANWMSPKMLHIFLSVGSAANNTLSLFVSPEVATHLAKMLNEALAAGEVGQESQPTMQPELPFAGEVSR